MSPFNLEACARPNILALQPYRCAREYEQRTPPPPPKHPNECILPTYFISPLFNNVVSYLFPPPPPFPAPLSFLFSQRTKNPSLANGKRGSDRAASTTGRQFDLFQANSKKTPPKSDYKDDGTNVLLDANENAYGPSIHPSDITTTTTSSLAGLDPLGLHRYPDPHQHHLKQLLCDLRNTHAHTTKTITPDNLFVGVGSDEAIDALLRCFCVPGKDRILTCPPTYGMYSVSAQVNDISLVKIPLTPAPAFALDLEAITAALSQDLSIKLAYFCSPGNPTGALLSKSDIEQILNHPTWNGVVVLDEAYVDFAPEDASLAELVSEFPNLVVMQTLSKAFGMAGIRLGAAFASPAIAQLLNNMKAPYNIASPTSALAQYALREKGLATMKDHRARIVAQRERLLKDLPKVEGVGRLRGGTASNFLLYEMLNSNGQPDNTTALAVYERLADEKGVVVRFRGKEHGCTGCLRITVGTEDEVTRFLDSLRKTLAQVRTTLV